MKRKYDARNKRNFIIIVALATLIVIIFSLFIYKYKHTSTVFYKVDTGSLVQDIDKNYVSISEDAILKVRWNDSYYLVYQDSKINLGKKVIVYNTITGDLKLYGKFYEIQNDGKIEATNEETKLSNRADTKFYKLDDREYLLVDRTITSDDGSLQADNYLLVELDKMGNAKLSNNKLNLKTISPMKLITSKYTFDIAGELLKYGKKEIDLKKIIGSTNMYDPSKDNKNDTEDDNNNGGGSSSGGLDGNGTAVGNGNNGVVNDRGNGGIGTTIGDLKDKVKMTSIVRVVEGMTQIDIDYVVYDPYNEYKSVYVEVVKTGKIDVIYLSKTDTHVVIDNLIPDTNYKLNFVYTTADAETNEIKLNKFEEILAKTKAPIYSGEVNGILSYRNRITYVIYLQEGFNISTLNGHVIFYYQELDNEDNVVIREKSVPISLDIQTGMKKVNGYIDITGYDVVNTHKEKVVIDSVTGSSGTINFN